MFLPKTVAVLHSMKGMDLLNMAGYLALEKSLAEGLVLYIFLRNYFKFYFEKNNEVIVFLFWCLTRKIINSNTGKTMAFSDKGTTVRKIFIGTLFTGYKE